MAAITCADPSLPTSSTDLSRHHSSLDAVAATVSVTVLLDRTELDIGDSTFARATRSDAWRPRTTWRSGDTSVATVSRSGVVRARRQGTAAILATMGGVTGQAILTVRPPAPPPAPVASVSVSLAAATIAVGATTTASAVLRDANGNVLTGRVVGWWSSAATYASVDSLGVVRGLVPGTTWIIGKSEGVPGSAMVTVVAAPPPPPPPPPPPATSLAFASDWSTAIGNTLTATQDGGRWVASNIAYPVPDRVSVVSAAGLGFPSDMANVLAIRYEQSQTRWSGVSRQSGWPLPAIGGVLARRMYFRMGIEGTSSVTQHPVQSAYQAGACPYAAEWVMSKGATFVFRIANLQDGGGDPANSHQWQTTLSRDVTYRVEERYERTGTATWKLHIRIYDQAGTLIRQDADFVDAYHNGMTLASQPNIVIPDASCLQHMMIVNQGVGDSRGSDNPAANRIYYGGFAVSLTDWVGPYRSGERR